MWIEWMIILINYAEIHSKMSKTVLISGQSARMDHTPWQTNETCSIRNYKTRIWLSVETAVSTLR